MLQCHSPEPALSWFGLRRDSGTGRIRRAAGWRGRSSVIARCLAAGCWLARRTVVLFLLVSVSLLYLGRSDFDCSLCLDIVKLIFNTTIKLLSPLSLAPAVYGAHHQLDSTLADSEIVPDVGLAGRISDAARLRAASDCHRLDCGDRRPVGVPERILGVGGHQDVVQSPPAEKD